VNFRLSFESNLIYVFNNNPVWWSSKKTYKNAITNELFLYTSALQYIRTHNMTYLDNALKVGALCYVSVYFTINNGPVRRGPGVCVGILILISHLNSGAGHVS
jgi:hypothetical protein